MSVDSTDAIGRVSLLAWQVSADQEEPWRRFLQELSGPRLEEYAESRRHLRIFAEFVWFAPKPCGGGVAVVYLEAEDPERALNELVAELAASETPFGLWLGKEMHNLFGYDFVWLPRVAAGELLFAWREMPGAGEKQPPEDS